MLEDCIFDYLTVCPRIVYILCPKSQKSVAGDQDIYSVWISS